MRLPGQTLRVIASQRRDQSLDPAEIRQGEDVSALGDSCNSQMRVSHFGLSPSNSPSSRMLCLGRGSSELAGLGFVDRE